MTPQEIAAAALAAAAGRDTEAVAIVDEVATAHLRWAGNAFTTGGIAGDRRLTVVALGAGRTPGVATASGALDVATVHRLVTAADRARRPGSTAEPDPPAPVTAAGGDGATADGGDGWHRPPAGSAAAGLPAFAARLAASFRSASAASHLLYGYAEQRSRTTYLASSAGLRRRHDESRAVLDHTVRSAGDPATWTGTCAHELSELDPGAAYAAARQRFGWWRRRLELPTAEYEVLLPPSCVADLMLRLYRAADARAALAGRTAFAAPGGTRIGERLSPVPLTLHSDPHQRGLECAPFAVARGTGTGSVYDNGLPLARTNWITDGVLSALVSSRQIAARTGAAATPEIGNLVLAGATGTGSTLDGMVAGTARGLLLTSLWYLRELDPRSLLLTGLTRDGVYLVEDGEIQGAVNPFRFNASPLGVLARVREVGRPEPTLPREHDEHTIRMAMPPLRVAGLALSAVRDAA